MFRTWNAFVIFESISVHFYMRTTDMAFLIIIKNRFRQNPFLAEFQNPFRSQCLSAPPTVKIVRHINGSAHCKQNPLIFSKTSVLLQAASMTHIKL